MPTVNEKILTKLRLRGYQPRARLSNVEIFGDSMFGDGDVQIARGAVGECFDYTWHQGETITTSPIREVNLEEGWIITRNSLYLVESWNQKSIQ